MVWHCNGVIRIRHQRNLRKALHIPKGCRQSTFLLFKGKFSSIFVQLFVNSQIYASVRHHWTASEVEPWKYVARGCALSWTYLHLSGTCNSNRGSTMKSTYSIVSSANVHLPVQIAIRNPAHRNKKMTMSKRLAVIPYRITFGRPWPCFLQLLPVSLNRQRIRHSKDWLGRLSLWETLFPKEWSSFIASSSTLSIRLSILQVL